MGRGLCLPLSNFLSSGFLFVTRKVSEKRANFEETELSGGVVTE